MKTFLAVFSTCLLLLVAAMILLLLHQNRQAEVLAAANEQLQTELAASRTVVEELSQEKEVTRDKMTSLEETASELNDRIESLETSSAAAQEALPKPYPVQAFVGRENVGQAWIVPHNIQRDETTGRYTFEPVLWLQESAKDHFTVHHTNVVEREVYHTTVRWRLQPVSVLLYWTPGYPGGTNRPPVVNPPIQPVQSIRPVMQRPSAQDRVFAPPFSVVNTRPQTLGRPATAPANARVFAP